MTLSKICLTESALMLDAIQKQLPLRTKVGLALDGWASTNKLAITSVIAQYINRNWALSEFQLPFDEIDRLNCSHFETQSMMIGQWPAYWSKVSRTVEGCDWLFSASRRPFDRYYDWYCFHNILDGTWAAMKTWGLWNCVASIEKPPTLHGARHIAGIRCIHEQSSCMRPYEVLGSLWVRSALWRGWKNRHWAQSKTLKRGLCYNQQGAGHESRFSKDNWASPYFMRFWKSWSRHWYSGECLLY